jgi:hypothetical protein
MRCPNASARMSNTRIGGRFRRKTQHQMIAGVFFYSVVREVDSLVIWSPVKPESHQPADQRLQAGINVYT